MLVSSAISGGKTALYQSCWAVCVTLERLKTDISGPFEVQKLLVIDCTVVISQNSLTLKTQCVYQKLIQTTWSKFDITRRLILHFIVNCTLCSNPWLPLVINQFWIQISQIPLNFWFIRKRIKFNESQNCILNQTFCRTSNIAWHPLHPVQLRLVFTHTLPSFVLA